MEDADGRWCSKMSGATLAVLSFIGSCCLAFGLLISLILVTALFWPSADAIEAFKMIRVVFLAIVSVMSLALLIVRSKLKNSTSEDIRPGLAGATAALLLYGLISLLIV